MKCGDGPQLVTCPESKPDGWATGTAWFKDQKCGTSSGPANSTHAGCGWIDLPLISRLLAVNALQLLKTWEPFLAALR